MWSVVLRLLRLGIFRALGGDELLHSWSIPTISISGDLPEPGTGHKHAFGLETVNTENDCVVLQCAKVRKIGKNEVLKQYSFSLHLSCKVEIRKDSLLGTVITDALLVLKYIKNNSVFIMFCLIWLQRASPEFKKLQ